MLGFGLGGFFDGIVFHQLLQWHHMASSARSPDDLDGLRDNVHLDGVFHAATYVFVAVGLVLLLRARADSRSPRRARFVGGSILIGAGSFNLVEGTVDHHLLDLHHVNETVAESSWIWWDLSFLLLGAALAVVGIVLIGRGPTP